MTKFAAEQIERIARNINVLNAAILLDGSKFIQDRYLLKNAGLAQLSLGHATNE